MDYTTNLNLKKPAYSDPADVAVLNENMDVIDNTAYSLKSEINGLITELGTESTVLSGGIIYTLTEDMLSDVLSITSESSVTYFSKNIFDQSTKVANTIKNDSGVETYDGGSCYYSQYIPCHGKVITSNFTMQRVYYFDENKAFLRRAIASGVRTSDVIPDDAYFVQIQVPNDSSGNSMAVWYGTTTPTYSEYAESNNFSDISGEVNAVCDGASAFSLTITKIGLDNKIKTLSKEQIADTFGTITLQDSYYVLTLSRDLLGKTVEISSDDTLHYFSTNIFDQSTNVAGKIKNDSGNETSDSQSSYYSQYIPCHGKVITSNFTMQRVYYFDENKAFLRRAIASGVRTSDVIPDDAYFVQIQVPNAVITDSMAISFGDAEPTYEAYHESDNITDFNNGVNVITDGATEFEATLTVIKTSEKAGVVPPVKSYGMWEPSEVTDDYSCTPLGQSSQSIPALNTLGWNGFLETYFDIYLGKYDDGYEVYREDFGLDSGAEATGNVASPVYSYVFTPKHYNRTVLLSAGMNTCEASTYFGLAYFIKALMEHTEDGMLALYNTTRFVVMPIICPSGIAHDPLLYPNSNGVRINKNFEYYGSWARLHTTTSGAYPDSEVETKILKQWLNKYRDATFWIDCHSDTDTHTVMKHLGTVFCSDSDTATKLTASKQSIIDYYVSKGYISVSDTVSLGFYSHSAQTAEYPKTQYAKEVCDIPAAMMEQFEYSTAWGSDGNTNNDSYAIKHYVAMIRYMVLIMCKGEIEIVD